MAPALMPSCRHLNKNPRIARYLNVMPESLAAIVVAVFTEFAIVRPAGGRTKSIGDIAKVTGNLTTTAWQVGRHGRLQRRALMVGGREDSCLVCSAHPACWALGCCRWQGQ